MSVNLQRVPNTTVALHDEQLDEIMTIIEKFEDDEDVQAVYHTVG